MLIAISGSQGSGKSSILKMLAKRGHHTIQRKTSRSILTDWGVTLNDVNGDHELTIKFQDEITKRKAYDEEMAALSNDIWFTERTHADLFVYALIDLGRNNEYNDWINNYYKTSLTYNQIYNRVYYLRAGQFNIEHDGVRGSNRQYSQMVDTIMLDFTRQMIHPSKFAVIETLNLDQRVDIIEEQCGMFFK